MTNIYNKKIFFIFGNEETYIKKIEKEISLNVYKDKNK